jgi:hypothetical protein
MTTQPVFECEITYRGASYAVLVHGYDSELAAYEVSVFKLLRTVRVVRGNDGLQRIEQVTFPQWYGAGVYAKRFVGNVEHKLAREINRALEAWRDGGA